MPPSPLLPENNNFFYSGRSSRREHETSQACHCSMDPTLCVNSDLTSADSAWACVYEKERARMFICVRERRDRQMEGGGGVSYIIRSVVSLCHPSFPSLSMAFWLSLSLCSLSLSLCTSPGGTCEEQRCTPSYRSSAHVPSNCLGLVVWPWRAPVPPPAMQIGICGTSLRAYFGEHVRFRESHAVHAVSHAVYFVKNRVCRQCSHSR